VRAADFNLHEIGAHLTLCHLFSEAVCVVTHSTLPKQHPLFQLLMPHFYKTLSLNENARALLVPTFIASRLSAYNSDQLFALAKKIFVEFNFEEKYVPNDLKSREVLELPKELYPFAETASSTWAALERYISKFFEHKELNDHILQDVYVQRWLTALGNVFSGFPKIAKIQDLVKVVTMVIYTPTHQHSAVNYFQKIYMSYVPSAPGFLKEGIPKDLSTIESQKDFLLRSYPRCSAANVQTALVDMLSDEPEEAFTMKEFKFGPTSTPHHVPWDKFDILSRELQNELIEALRPYTDKTAVNLKNLAQSVLI